ncbi:MAG: hypothetical protein FWD68_05600 [Alphaproteobacteria bacterium]|nr:hypothetical protein [Alphaproteobacteria bacterium]
MNRVPQTQNCALATIAWAHGMVECAVAVSMLEAAGVPVLVHSGATASVAPQMMTALGGIRLQVPGHLAQTAQDVLAGFEPAEKPRAGFFEILALILLFVLCHVPPPASGFAAARAVGRAASRVSPVLYPLISAPPS